MNWDAKKWFSMQLNPDNNLPIDNLKKELPNFVALTFEFTWLYRNNCIHGEELPNWLILGPLISKKAKEYWKAALERRAKAKFQPDATWEKPTSKWLKANFDEGCVAYSSCIIRDAILGAWTMKEDVGDSFGAKASAVNFAFIIGEDLGCNKIIIEGDVLFYINALNGDPDFQN